MDARFLTVSLGVLLGSCAGGQHPWSGEKYCELEGPEAAAAGHEKWIKLLLRGYDPETRRVTTPALDCTTAQVRWEAPAAACFDNALTTTLLPPRALGPADVVVSPMEEGLSIVWVITNRFASGDGLGPVAVVDHRWNRLTVRVLGALRAYPDGAALRIERIGDAPVLVAEGRLCASADPASCVRSARVMPLRSDRFSPEPLLSDAGVCVSPAWFDLDRREKARLESGWTRSHELSASLVFGADGLRIEEQLLVNDVDPKDPQPRPRLFRKAQGERIVKASAGRLVTSGRSVWATVVNGGN